MSTEAAPCVVIPFGVPTAGAGLGLGLAAAVHSAARLAGAGVAIARLQASTPRDRDAARGREVPADVAAPLEVFMTPDAWRDMASRGDRPSNIGLVLTGAFEPPVDGEGTIRLLAFDAGDGRTRAALNARVDGEQAGASLVGAIEQFLSELGGDIGALAGLRELSWDVLESVLLAERCALHDPARGGPHDGLAALLHFGRAIGDAPSAHYPVQRLAATALEVAAGSGPSPKLAHAAMRALEGAALEASEPFEAVEALGVLLIRLGDAAGAERRMNAALVTSPERARFYLILAQALRAQGKLDGALAALDQGLARTGTDVSLYVERGAVLAARDDWDGALAAWRDALALEPLHAIAFQSVADVAIRRKDFGLAQSLVDRALAAVDAHPDFVRAAIRLTLASETDGLARAARLATLCRRVLERVPNDAWVLLIFARTLLALGQPAEARLRLDRIERIAPQSGPAAEAQAVRLALDQPAAERELESVARAAFRAPVETLGDVVARARRLATEHVAWPGWVAAAIAEGRRGRWPESRASLAIALEIAPGAAPAHIEMARALLALGDTKRARSHAEKAIELEGPSPQALALISSVVAAEARPPQKETWTTRAKRAWSGLKSRSPIREK